LTHRQYILSLKGEEYLQCTLSYQAIGEILNPAPLIKTVRPLCFLLLAGLNISACVTVHETTGANYAFSRSILNVHHPARVAGHIAQADIPEIDDLKPSEIPTPTPQKEIAEVPVKQKTNATSQIKRPTAKVLRPPQNRKLPAAIRASNPTKEVLKSAQRLAGLRMSRSQDFIRHILRVNDLQVKASGRSEIAERLLQKIRKSKHFKTRGKPAPGDFVFFEQTRPGFTSGVPSLVGVVDHVDRHGTIHFFAQVGEVVDRSVVTPRKPAKRRDGRTARVLNSYVRTKRSNDAKNTEYLAGQLLLGYGKL
jgi:hypothetical protein